MGFFVYLCSRFRCLRCGMDSEASIQTKLFRTEADNSSREYRVGDSEIVDGMEDYCPLYPWDGSEPLVAAVGDWSCRHCDLGGQWAKLVLTVKERTPSSGEFSASIKELSRLVPIRPSALDGVHLVESWLAELSGSWGTGSDYDWAAGRDKWLGLPASERCERVAAGFRTWCRWWGNN